MGTGDHRLRVKAIIDAALDGGVNKDDVAWARRVLQGKNDKTLSSAIDDLLRRTGPVGEAILERRPDFSAVASAAREE